MKDYESMASPHQWHCTRSSANDQASHDVFKRLVVK